MGHAAKMQSARDVKMVINKMARYEKPDGTIASERTKNKYLRNAVLYAMLYYTARRITDVIQLRWSDVMDPTSTYRNIVVRTEFHLVEGKTGKYTRVVLNEDLRILIGKYYRKANPRHDAYIFHTQNGPQHVDRKAVWRTLRTLFERYGVDHACPHGLRKAAARQIYDAMGANHEALITVQKILAHRDSYTTLTYIGINAEKIKQAFNYL
jgi:integrase